MQAVILAAGKSTRTYPLTLTRPKPLLKVANKTILEYNLEALKDYVDEIIMVVGYKKDMIKKFTKENHPDLNIKFIEQKEQLGTGHAASILKDHIKDKFILMLGDNIYSKEDIVSIKKHKYSIITKEVKEWKEFGVVKVKNNILVDIIEKPKKFISNLVSCGLFALDTKIFYLLEKVKRSERGEYELTDALKELSMNNEIYCEKSHSCHQISFPWDLLTADKQIRNKKNIIGNSEINGDIMNSSIGDNCTINGTVKNSIIMGNSIIDKDSVVEDSIIGENVHFKGKIIAKNNIFSTVKNKKIKVSRLGSIIGDNVKADNVDIGPGCKIWPDKEIKGEIKYDIQ
jgi:UDP-N-acetylglucosamine diphosphorylase / glucose-1-phosphate thymidylyltransferase / UDP-N-acetylgalactosamine diphosphorylase / glucosamine-1-phosphate N-acetyltransferase / galactosamine-1-phosphate N-acetyltransferase